MKRQKIPEDGSKDVKQAKVQVGHKMCIKKRRVTKVQQNVIKKISATFCQTMEVEESCAIVKRRKVPMSLGPNKHYVPHVSLSKKKTAACHQTKVSSSHTRKTFRKSPKQMSAAVDKHVEENVGSVGKTSLETSRGDSQSANQEKMRSPKNLIPNKSVLGKIQGKRGRQTGKVSPSSSNTAVQNTSRRLSPTCSKGSEAVSTQHSKPNKNTMLLRSNETTSSVLHSRRKSTLKMHPETSSKVHEGVCGASTHHSTQCNPSDAIHAHAADECHSHYSDSFNEADTSQQETNASLIVQLSPIKLNLLARQTSSTSRTSSSESMVIDSNEHAEDMCIFSDIGCTCNAKLVDETKTAKQKYGSQRKRVKSSELTSESYRHVWKSTSTHQKQSTLLLPRHCRSQEIKVKKGKSVRKTTTLLRPNKMYTSGCQEREKTDQQANAENGTRIVVVGPNKRCIPVLSKKKEETKNACSCKGLHTCHSQQKQSAVGGVNSTTKWVSTINTAKDNCAVNQKETTSCTKTLKNYDKPSDVTSAKRFSSPASTQMDTESLLTCKSPQVPIPKCQIIDEKEVQVTNTPESLTVEGKQTKPLIQNEVSVTLNKLCYESVTHRLQQDDYGYNESEASSVSVPQRGGTKRKYLRNRKVAETLTSLKSDSEREVPRTSNIDFDSAGLSKTQSTRCQSNINPRSAIEMVPRRNSLLQTTSLRSKDTNNDTAKGKSSTTLSKKRNAKDLSERIQKDSRLKSPNTRVSDEHEHFMDSESRGAQVPPILQDHDNLKTVCQATLEYSPKIVMGLRPYARYRSNGGKNHSHYNSKHWLLVQGQIDSQEEQAHLLNAAPVCLKGKGKGIRKRKRGRKNLGLQQKENEENPNQSVPIVQDNVSTETLSCVPLEAHGASSVEPPKLAVRTSKDLQETTTDLTQEKKRHEKNVTSPTIQSGLQKDMNDLKGSFCEVDSGANDIEVEVEKDEKPTPSKTSHETSRSESEAVTQTTSATIQVSREKGDNPNPIISQTQTLDEDSVSPEPDSSLSPVNTEHETQTSDCKVVAEADGTLSLIISSSETPSPTPDVEVVSQSTLVQVYVPVQSGHGQSPPCIISPHHTESPSSDEGTLSEHESCSTYIISPRGSINPDNKAVTLSTSGDGSFSNFNSPLETENPDNKLETQDTDSEVQRDQEGFLQGIDLIQSRTSPGSEAVMQSVPVDIKTQASSIDIRLNKDEDVTIKERSLFETFNPVIEEQESPVPNCDTGIEAVDISDQLEQDDRPIQIVCDQESFISDYERGIENDDISDQLEQDDRPIQIVCEDDKSSTGCETGIENDDISDQLEQDDRPIHIVREDDSSSPGCETEIENDDILDQLEQDDRPIHIVCEQDSLSPDYETEIENDDISDQLEQDDRPIQIVCEQDSLSPVSETGLETVDISDQLEQDDCPIHIVSEQESPTSCKKTESVSDDVSAFSEQDFNPAFNTSQREIPQSDFDLGSQAVSDTSVKDFELPLVQSDSTRGKDKVVLQSPNSDAEPLIDLGMQPCNNPVEELTSSSRPAEAKFIGEGDSDSVTVVIQPDSPSKYDKGNLLSTSEKSSCMSKSKAQENIQGEQTKPTLSEDVNKSFNFKQLWNIKRVPKDKGQEITYFYERVDEEEGEAASRNDSDNGPEATRIPQKPQLMYKKDKCHGKEKCNEPKSISLDSPSLLMKENEEQASEELNSVQPASSLGNSDANRKPDGLSTQNEIRKVTESPVTLYQSQREKQSCLSKQTTRKLQRSRGCQFEKRNSSLEFETFADSLQVSTEESSSFEKLPPYLSSDSSSSSSSISFLHTSPEGQELTPMFEGSSPGEVSTSEINERPSAVELDSEMVETPFTTSLKGNLSEHVEMSKETGNETRVRKTKIWQNSLLASMTLRKKDEHFLFSRLGFKKSKQRKSQMSEQRKYMGIKRELSQIPGEDCVKSEPLFRTENQHQESRHQSNSIVPEITDQTCHQRNHMFTSAQTRQRLGKRNLTASKTLNSEDYIFPAKRIKQHQLSSTLLTGSVLTNNPGRSKFGISVPHHLLVPRKRGRPKKVPLQDPALSESSVVSGTTGQTQLLNHQAVGEENLTEISRQDDTEARGVHLIDSSVSLLSGQGKRGQSKTSHGHCSQSIETPVVKEKPSLLIPPDNHVDNPRFKLEQDACDQSLLPFEPQKKNYQRKILSQGNKDQSFDAATSTPRKRGRPKKNPPTSFTELHQLEKDSIIESKVRKPYTKKLWTSKVKRVYTTKGKWSWKFQASDLHELKPKRKYCRKTNSLSGIQGNQQSQEFKPKRKYCRKINSLSGNNSNQQGQEPKPKRKYCRKTNSLSGIIGNQQSEEPKPKRKYCRKTNSLSGLQEFKPKRKYCRKTNSLSGLQELKPKRKYCRKTNSLSGLQELKPKRKYCRKTNSLSGLQELKPKRKYCRKTNSLSGLQELKPKRKYCRKTNSLSGLQGNQQSQEFKPKRKYCRKTISLSGLQELKPKRKYCRKTNSLSGLQELKPKRKYCRKTNSLSGLQGNQQSQELKPKRKYCRKTNSLSGFQGNQQSQEPKPKRKYCRKIHSLSGIIGNQQSQELKPKRKYCRKVNSLSGNNSNQQIQDPKPKRKYCRKIYSLGGIKINQQSQELKPKRKYCRKINSLSGIIGNQQSEEPKPKRKYCRKIYSLGGIEINQQSQELKPKRKYCRKMNSLSGNNSNQQGEEPKPKRKYCRKIYSLDGIEINQQSQELKPKRKYCRKMNSLSGNNSYQQGEEPKPKRKYCRKINSLSGNNSNQQSQEPKPKRKYCRKTIFLSGINRNLQSQEPKPKRKYCRKTNSLTGIKRTLAVTKPLQLSHPLFNKKHRLGKILKSKKQEVTHKKMGRPKKSSLSESETLSPNNNKNKSLEGLASPKDMTFRPKKMGRPKKIPLSEVEAPSTTTYQLQTLQPQIIKGSFLGECGGATRPKKMGRPRKIPLSEVEAPSTTTYQLQTLQPQIVKGNSLGECVEPTTRPKKMGRPRKIPLSEVEAPSTTTYQLQTLQPQIIIGNSLVECVEPAARPKKMGRPRKIPLSEVEASSTTTYQLQTLQPQIVKGNSLGECVEPTTRPKKMGRPRKIPLSEVAAPSTTTYQLQTLQPHIIKGNSLVECVEPTTRPKKMGRPKKIPLSEVEAPSTPTDQLQTLQPQIIKENSLVECVEPTTRPKKMGRPRKIPLSEVAAPSTPTDQLQTLQPHIIKGNSLVECVEPTMRPKKMGRPRKIPLSEVAAPSTPTEQLQSIQPEIIKGNSLGECVEPATRPKKMGRPKKLNTSVSGSKATLSITDQLQLTHKIQVLIPGYVGPAKDEEFILEEFCSLESLEEAVQSAATEWKPHRGNKISRKRKNTNSLSHLTTTSAANSRRAKRSSRSPEGSYWDCSVCTYRNKAEAFKCAMCDVRKGTSTRKPRLNAQLVAQQQAQQNLSPLIHVKTAKTTARSPAQRKAGTSKKPRPRLKNVDRSSAISTEVVVNNVPVIITEYKEKSHTRTTIDSDDASAERTNGNVNGL